MPSLKPKRRDAVETRTALLTAAGAIFAARGFHDANVREICARAGTNLGAVSHYFGSKETLYREVLVESHRELLSGEPMPTMQPGDDPRRTLRIWIEYVLRFVLVRRPNHPHAGPILMREIREPTAALDDLVGNVLMPVKSELSRVVGAILDEVDSPSTRGRCATFVFGLCVFHELGHEVLARLGRPVPRTEAELAPLVEAITTFALGGIDAMAGRNASASSRHDPPAE